MQESITKTNITELKKVYSGKVRDIYEISSKEWLMVATDRISAFDVVFSEGIPDKGRVLTQVSNKWFSKIDSVKNHIISVNPVERLDFLNNYESFNERSVIIKKVNRLPIECVVRGYLFGSVFKEYTTNGTAGGNKLPSGILLAGKLDDPIFTPATKAESGHDENIDYKGFINAIGKELGDRIIELSISIYNEARDTMAKKGILLADTKFEFGLDDNDELILVDEVLTPDSSRYWDASNYKAGESPKSYDKQFVRDYLSALDWDKTPPGPPLPEDIILRSREKYLRILEIIEQI